MLDTISSCLSAYRLDRHFLGAESPEERKETLAHIADCATCQHELELLGRWQAKAPVQIAALERSAPATRSSSGETTSGSWWRGLQWGRHPAWGLAVLCVILGGALTFLWRQPWDPEGGYSTIRGGSAKLLVIRKRGEVIRRIASGDISRAGDLLRLVVQWRPGGFVYIVHRAPDGELSPLYPAQKAMPSLRLHKRGQIELPGSLEVEGAPQGDEMLWACFSNKAIRFEAMVQVVKQLHQRWPASIRRSPALSSPRCQVVRRFVLSRLRGTP